MGHDQLFKAVLERLFQGFLELFFPEVAARLDFETRAASSTGEELTGIFQTCAMHDAGSLGSSSRTGGNTLRATQVILSYPPDCANSSSRGTTMSGFCVRSASFVSRMPSEVWRYARFVLGSMTHTERTPKER